MVHRDRQIFGWPTPARATSPNRLRGATPVCAESDGGRKRQRWIAAALRLVMGSVVLATVSLGIAHSAVYTTVTHPLHVWEFYATRSANSSAAFSLSPLRVLAPDGGASTDLPLEVSLDVLLHTDRRGGSITPEDLPGIDPDGLLLIEVSNDLTPETTGHWETVLTLGNALSHSGFGWVARHFPATRTAFVQPSEEYRYVRAVFAGTLTPRDRVTFLATVRAVPEAGISTMLLAGAVAMGFIARRRLR